MTIIRRALPAALLLLLGLAVPARAQNAGEEQAVRDVIDALFEAAFNHGMRPEETDSS